MRRHTTKTMKELHQLVRSMNASSDRTFGTYSEITGLYKGSPKYRHCLTETVDGVIYKRTAWHSSFASLLADIRKRAAVHEGSAA